MSALKFRAPLPGTFVCLTDDKLRRGCDRVECVLEAPAGHTVTVNGTACTENIGVYTVTLPLSGNRMELTAKDETTGETALSHVFRAYIRQKIYRVSVDDNIWWLQDLARNQDRYESIFENAYLAMYRRLHEQYGAKFHFNIYYTCPEHGGFSLPELSDKFKPEFQAVNDWMTLSFHARANLPDWPYSHAPYEQVYEDCSAVMDEIERFAGCRGKVTTLHFAEATPDGVRALYDCGVRALLGDFELMKDGAKRLCYYANGEQFDTVRRHSFWKDPDTKMIFFSCDAVLNTFRAEDIPAALEEFDARDPDRAFMDILIHEQYFYPDYSAYLPEYEQLLRTGIEWCISHGYAPGLVKDIIDFNDPALQD